MLQLLAPWFLPALSAMLVPVVLHLLHKRKRRVVSWGAMQFLRPDKKSQRRASLRLKDWMLLALRMLCVAAVVAFFMRPQVRVDLPQSKPRDVVIVLDASMSTAQIINERSAWLRMSDKAKALLETLNANDTVRVLLAADSASWLTPQALAGTAGGRQQVLEQILATEPGEGACRWPECLTEAVLARPPRPGMSREVIIFTDGQAHGVEADNTAAWTTLRDATQQSEQPCRISVVLAGPDESPNNPALIRIDPAREHASAGETVLLRAHVKNFGSTTSITSSLRWLVDGKSSGLSVVPPLQPGRETSIDFYHPVSSEPGVHEIVAELQTNARDDVLRADNHATTLIETLDATEVLLVDGSGRTDPKNSDIAWMEAALAVEDGSDAVFRSRSLPWVQFDKAALDSKTKVVVLANPPLMQQDMIDALQDYVRHGGGLWLMLGDQAEKASATAATLFQDGRGLSPLKWTEAVGVPGDEKAALKLRITAAEHPVTRLLLDSKHSDLDRVRVFRHFNFSPDVGEGTRTLLVTADGSPFLAEKPFGAGRVLIQAAPCNFAWADWPKHQAFVVLLHEGLWRLGSSSFTRRNLLQGETFVWPMAAAISPMVRLPGGTQITAFIDTLASGALEVRVTDTMKPGAYALEATGVDARFARFTVARDAAESDLTPLSEEQREQLTQAGGLAFSHELPVQGAGAVREQRSIDLTTWLAALAALCLLLESALATWLLRRRHRAMEGTVTA